MGEVASSYVSVYPKIVPSFGAQLQTQMAGATKGAFGPIEKQSEDSGKRSGKKFGDQFRGVATTLVAAVGIHAIGDLVQSSVDAFAELQDSSAAAAVIFGDSMGSINEQAETAAEKIGLSKQQVISAANTFGTYGKSAKLAGQDLADFSTDMTQLAGDMASFKGTSTEQAVEAIGAAMRGEMEPIRAYGVMLDDATLRNEALRMGLIKTAKDALTPQQKILAAQAAILKQTADAQGDYARTSDSTANVSKTLAAKSADLSAELGEKLAPAMTAAKSAGIELLDWATANEAALVPVAATFGALTLAVGGFVAVAKGIEALKSAKETVDGLRVSFTQLSTGAKIATISLGAAGAAAAAAGVIYGMYAQKAADAQAAVEDYTAAIEADSGALGENTRRSVVNRLEREGMLAQALKMGISTDTLTDAIMGNSEAYAIAKQKSDEYAKANVGQSSLLYGATGAALGFNQKLDEQVGLLQSGAEAQKRTASAIGQTAAATSGLDSAMSGANSTVYAGKVTFEDYTKAINGTYNAQLKLRGDQRSLEAAIDDVSESVKKNGKTLDINTEKGRANQAALDGVAAAGLDLVAGLKAADAPTEKIAAQMDKSRDSFIKAAESMGMGTKEAQKLADKLGLIKGKNIEVTASVTMNQRADEIEYKIGKSGTVKFTAKALGGPVSDAYGVRGLDSVPSLLMPDEHVLTVSDVQNLGGHDGVFRMRAMAQKGLLRFAGGGPVMPSYNGHSLEWWKDYLLSDVEFTRLQIQIRDLQRNLAETETYNPPGARKKARRQKLRGLDRTAAQQELKEAREKLELAKQAAKANSTVSGSIADQLAEYEQAKKSYESAMSMWQSAADSLSRSTGLGSMDALSVKRTNAAGDVWYEKQNLTAADLASRVNKNAAQVKEFIGLLGELRKAGASDALIADVEALGPVDGTVAAKLYLADRASLASANAAYASLSESRSTLLAIGNQAAAKVEVNVYEAATPEATAQAVTNKLLAGRT